MAQKDFPKERDVKTNSCTTTKNVGFRSVYYPLYIESYTSFFC